MSKVFKILSIGNSFSEDAHAYLHQVLLSAGVENVCINLVIGGCTLETHANNMKNNNRSYMLQINGEYVKQLATIEETVGMFDWDVITNQQASVLSGKPETFDPYLGELLAYFNEKSPESKKYLQKTWAYECDATLEWFSFYDRDQEKMYGCICDTFDTYSKKYNVPYIPSGDVIQALRGKKYFEYPGKGMSLHRDGFHLNIPYGRYAVSLTWAKTLADINLEKVTYVPEGADPEICAFIRSFVNDYLKK